MLRWIIGLVVGLVVGSVFNMALIMVSWALYPMPEGTSVEDPEKFSAYVQSLPAPAFLIIILAHAGGALVGAAVGAAIAGRKKLLFGTIIGAFFLLGGIINALSIPAPVWFVALDLLAYIPCGLLGAKLVSRSSPSHSA